MPKPKVMLNFRVDRERMRELLRLAHKQDTTVSAVLRAALDAYLYREEPRHAA